MTLDYGRLNRMLVRCEEIAADAGIAASVTTVYRGVLKDASDAFRAAHNAIAGAETSFKKENREALEALARLDKPYATTRAVVKAFVPDTVLPETLKALPTDTDKLDAIQDLLDVLDSHHGEAWAAEQLAGEFGKQAPETVRELQEGIAANKGLAKAVETRSTAFGPAWEKYIRFKNVVRAACGPKSAQYRRIHIRSGKGGEEEPATEPVGGAPQPPPES